MAASRAVAKFWHHSRLTFNAANSPSYKSMYGITLMYDGWSGTTKSSLINFLVFCDRQVFYHKSVDASNHIHNHQYILQLME
ncbi:hypothetical protein Taro_041186 [Colocasia esculenta]|uniref:DUF659 domain-containing protein n=1 Tax=Colocasia esculenta TaxID=4460 RepID=A0A843WF51_COLES|nr:hypothetical protein [Colocasia esculenta]